MDNSPDTKHTNASNQIQRRPFYRTGYQKARETGLLGMDLVIEELIKRGASVEKAEGRANRLIVRSKDKSRQVTIQIKTKGRRSRHWHVSAKDGRNSDEPVDPNEFWVLVDLSRKDPHFYILSGTEFRQMVYDEYRRLSEYYLEYYERLITPDSIRGTIERYRVEEYEDFWELLRL